MSEATSDAASAPKPEIRKRRGPSLVWLIPIVALLIGGGIAYRTITSKGPTITLVFSDGSGLEAGKTKIKYKDVEIGLVTVVDLSDDLQAVTATAELDPRAEPHLTENTVFWKVSPQVSLSGISGLGTLVSGQYIAILPKPGAPRRQFEGLEMPPLTASHRNALGLELVAEALGSVAVGSPVTYRSITVGQVEKYDLVEDGRSFRIHVLIDRPYAKLVRESTQFWNASGLAVTVGVEGLQLESASLVSLLQGGIAFDTPEWDQAAPAAQPGASYTLHKNPRGARQERERRHGLNIMVEALDGSIAEGAPVTYRKRKVGHVGASEFAADATSVRYEVHIDERYTALVRSDSRFWNASGVRMHLGIDGLELQTESLGTILAGGLEFATPSRPGPQAEPGKLFALHEAPEEEWLAWAPAIFFEGEEERHVAHVLLAQNAKPRGLEIILESFTTASMKDGDAIYYREVKVGEVGQHELAKDATTVRIHARIEPEYATLVRSNSRFWNTSGIDVHFGLKGLDIRTGSLESMLAGGVAFATPDEPGDPVEPGTIFPLHPEAEEEWEEWSPTLWVGARPGSKVKHAIHAKTHGHLRKRRVQSEAVAPPTPVRTPATPAVAAPPTPDETAATPAVAAPPPEEENEAKPGFFRRIFGRGDNRPD